MLKTNPNTKITFVIEKKIIRILVNNKMRPGKSCVYWIPNIINLSIYGSGGIVNSK
jgi:hypothetical protein